MLINQIALLAAGTGFLLFAGNPIASIPVHLDHQPVAVINQALVCPSSVDNSWTSSVVEMFPVRLKGCVVARLSSQQAADQLTDRLQALIQDPTIDWSALRPQMNGSLPTVQLGAQKLTEISSTTADRLARHAHELAVEWANNIRIVAGVPPIDLATAQQQMYHLTSTNEVVEGAASWYGPYFHGRMTANGEIFNQYDLTAAHRTLPLGTFVKVTNQRNGRTVVVRINDRGPYYDEDSRVLDLSYQAARVLGSEEKGLATISLEVLKTQPLSIASIGGDNNQ
jgi:rare lipoprotein A